MNQPWLAAVLNVIFPGLGYIYNRQRVLLGIGLAVFSGAVYFSIFTSTANSSPTSALVSAWDAIGLVLLLFGLGHDAYQEADKLNRAKASTPNT